MIELQIRTKLPENCALGVIKAMQNVITKVEGLTDVGESIKGLFQIKGRDISRSLSELPETCDSIVLSKDEAKILIKEHTCMVALPILQSGCILKNVDVSDSTLIWDLICDDEAFKSLMSKLEDYGVEFDILYKGKPSKTGTTYREEEILRFALERGYFDFPKKIRLEEIADHFGIASSTLSEILRRGMKKVLERHFKEGSE
ncbi:helix-turn-helix domain-containing protein [Geoglobus acetivorans]|uniref:Helix-turn-helix domain-containing protein n=1 Tax=Geoglobus acetivorans TaxID=565033 RepID=A0ABZ3H2Z5_GEOAI|nr:helix-turn-helix domain-containing protein [Geoglobus acetivorans]